ncbi:MAG: DUF1993 domain-containing protein [Polyangiaceae bacterium]
MNVHQLAIAQPVKMLRNVAKWLGEAEAFAEGKGFDADRLLGMRLAPDQFELVRQIQSACDAAKFIGARLAAVDPPKNADDEETIAQARDRIQATVAFLESIQADALDGAADRKIVLPFLPEGQWVRGEDYLIEFALPNLYFHVTTAYAILRHNGVGLGKRAFIGGMNLQGG